MSLRGTYVSFTVNNAVSRSQSGERSATFARLLPNRSRSPPRLRGSSEKLSPPSTVVGCEESR